MNTLPNQKSDQIRQILTLVAIVAAIGVNALSNIFPPNGLNVGQISNTVFAAVLLTPANYAFAIWGLIYVGLVALGIYQLQPMRRQSPKLRYCGYRLVIASVAQCAWIYLFLARWFPLSLIAMVAILLPLAQAYVYINRDRDRITRQEHWFIHAPVSLYFGWITVATVVNVTLTLYSFNWQGGGISPTIWTVVMMAISTAIATKIRFTYHDPVYVGVIVWALIAIAIRQLAIPLIAIPAAIMAVGLLALMGQDVRSSGKV
jgi:hypothetical protein